MRIIRFFLGQCILFFNWLTFPKPPQRSAAAQAQIAEQLNGMTLYHYRACPFCVKVRRALARLGASVAMVDAKRDTEAAEQLLAGGGRLKVPCLRIEQQGEVRWLYESNDIIAFIETKLS